MVTRKTKKVNKYRGSTTHGGGHRKKRRGAGSRGGRGNAGSGKRAGHKKYGKVLGRTGFLPRRGVPEIKAITVGYFTLQKVNKLVVAGKAVKEGDAFSINLGKLGYGKLLGTGNTSLKLNLQVDSVTASAEEKIASAGGKVISSGQDKSSKSKKA
ncbi:MAG: uL15m family ribosomal protein [archaeon]|nr:uL15m family ribosomal protein [archaeon]